MMIDDVRNWFRKTFSGGKTKTYYAPQEEDRQGDGAKRKRKPIGKFEVK
jgi:hypothetical protein